MKVRNSIHRCLAVEFFRPNKLVQKLLATLPSRSRIRKAFATLPDLVEALLLISRSNCSACDVGEGPTRRIEVRKSAGAIVPAYKDTSADLPIALPPLVISPA